MTTPSDLLARALRSDPARPLLTYYDDATGERAELSVATTANWVDKTAFMLVDGLDVQPGDRVAVRLPLHWQTACVLLAVWAVGAEVVTDDDADAAVVFAAEDRLTAAVDAAEVVGLSLRPLGAPLAGEWPGVLDYAAEVAAYGHPFTPVTPSGEWAAMAGVSAAREWELGRGDRVLTVLDYDSVNGMTAGLVAPLAADAGVVLVRHPDLARLERRAAVELVSATAGVEIPGVRPLPPLPLMSARPL